MAEDLERRLKQRKVFPSQTLALESEADDDILGQTGRKKGRPPKDTVMMNQGSVSSGHHVGSGSSSSSKTVAAILKQAKDQQVSPKEISKVQQQQQPQHQKKKSKQSADQTQQASTILNQLSLSKTGGSPLGRVASPSVIVSPAMSPSSIRGVSPLGKEHNHPVTTKSSSLSRDLSPSRITAQMVKVMGETTTTSTTPNLLRSALQGNMPDPMGILSSSKTEGGVVTVVTCTSGILPPYSTASRKSPANIRSLSPSSNSVSGSFQQTHTFSKILTSIAGAGGYLGLQDVDSLDSKAGSGSMTTTTQSTVETLLTSSDGTIQTANVSHIPKAASPSNPSIGTTASSMQSSSPRPSTRSAMEIAQQIKMEANGQKSSAQLAAMRPGMQQQLMSQIQSSRSIDAQLAPRQTPGAFSKGYSASQRASPKDSEAKTLEASMPLLASKLSPSVVSSTVAKTASVTMPSHFKQQQQQLLSGDSSMLLSSLSSSAQSAPSSQSLSSTTSVSSMGRKGQHISPVKSSSTDSPKPRQQQHNLLRHQQQQSGGTLLQSKQLQSEPAGDHSWTFQQQAHAEAQPPPAINLAGGLGEIFSGLDKQQALERLIQASISGTMSERMVQTDTPMRVESHAQTKHLGIQHGFQNASSASSQTSSSVQASGSKGGLKQPGASAAQAIHALSKCRPGESKQTAIDVDIDIGQLASIGDGPSIQTGPTCGSYVPGKDNKHGALYSALGQQLFNTPVSASHAPTVGTIVTKSRDSQAFVPVHAAKTSSSVTPHSVQTTSSLAHIPKPIVHSSSFASSSSSSLSTMQSSTSTSLPPPPDYTPPPPYPAKLSQQYHQGQPQQQHQHQQQFISSKTGQAAKPSVQNPFTFPTKGVTVHTDHDSHGLLSYSLTSQHNISGSSQGTTTTTTGIKQESFGSFREPKGAVAVSLSKSQSDVVAFGGRQPRGSVPVASQNDMPRLVPEVSDVKLENSEDYYGHNHVGDVKEERKPLVQPFNQRISNLSCFPVMNPTYRAAYRSHAVAVQKARSGVITNTAKSLDILRQNLQRSINKELVDIIKRYIDKYFQPALENIKQNNSDGVTGDEHINYVCRQILEEAKTEYMCESDRRSVTPSDIPDNVSETGSLSGRRMILKRSRISDSDSEKGSDGGFKRKIAKKKGRTIFQGSGRTTPSKTYKSGDAIKREGPKWDPERLKVDTLFVMGARANKALGLGNTRGRLYIRHPDVFKYIGDQEDKLWLYEHNLMPATGGKAYMLLLEDIEDLSRSDDYKDSPGLMMHECVGFTVPEWMLVKMKEQMNALRSDSSKRSLSRSPASELGEPRPKVLPFSAFAETSVKEESMVSPADTEEMDFVSTADNDDTRPSSAISPFTVTGGFEDGVSPTPSDLDPIEDPQPVPSLFS